MSVNLTTLFTRIGKMGGILNSINTFIGTTIPAKTDSLADQFSTDREQRDRLYQAQTSWQTSNINYPNFLRTFGKNVVIDMVNDDNPQPDNTIRTALIELIRQMEVSGDSVQRSVLGSSVSSLAANTGDASLVVSTKLPSGDICENALAEDIVVKVTADAYTGGAILDRELARAAGEKSESNVLSHKWPRGSGGSAVISLVDAALDAQGGNQNYLTNSDFEDFTANDPDQWTIAVGTAGVSVLKQVGDPYKDLSALEFVGDGAELTAIYQVFGDEDFTNATLAAKTQYAFNCWLKVSVVPAGGVLRVALVDGSNVVINDDFGTANSFTKTLSAATTSYVPFTGVFRTPSIMPDEVRIMISLTTALSTGSSLYIDHAGLTRMVSLYSGGPSVALFSGDINALVNDTYIASITNTAGGFQRLFDRFCNMKGLNLLLPSATSPTISDSLIA